MLRRVVGAIKNARLHLGFMTWFDSLYGETKTRDALGGDVYT